MPNFVRNVDLMRNVDSSTAPLNEMIANNDLQHAAMKLRDDMRNMDRDSFMVELGEVQRTTANTPTHLTMRPIVDAYGTPKGKDIDLVTTGVDCEQKPIDLSIPIGQIYNDRCLPYQEPIVVRPDCAFQLSSRPGDGWYHDDAGAVFFGGVFPDGKVRLDVGRFNLDIRLGGAPEHKFYEGATRQSNNVIDKTVIVNRTTDIIKNVHEDTTINNVQNNTVNENKAVNNGRDAHHKKQDK